MKVKQALSLKTILSVAMLFMAIFIFTIKSEASTVNELKTKISEWRIKQQEIDKEIAELEQKSIEAGKNTQTLKSALSKLDVNKKKIEADIKSTENRITIANLSIEKAEMEIVNTQERIQVNKEAISSAFRKIDVAEGISFIETILTYDNVSTLWDEVETLLRFQIGVKKNIDELRILKNDLQNKKNDKEKNKKELLNVKSELKDRNNLIEINKEEKVRLLSDTKEKEFNYRKILAEKKSLSDAFAKELLDFESQLKIAIDPKSIPSVGAGILFWPLDKIFVTQYFGNTDFAMKTNAYKGKGHNGVDFQATQGTRVKAALDGTVVGEGDTDKVCKGASFGKWVLIRHNNGLSTLYAHLSLIKVFEGKTVKTGDVIGYSGNTGYSTGPHLHFTLYATQGVQIMDRQSAVCGGTYHMPFADFRAYLNPMLYL